MEQENLTVDKLQALIALRPKPSPWRFIVVKPEIAKQVRAEVSRPIKPGEWLSEFTTTEIIEKPGQLMAGWVFADRGMLDLYLAGIFSELDLARFAVHGDCQSVNKTLPKGDGQW